MTVFTVFLVMHSDVSDTLVFIVMLVFLRCDTNVYSDVCDVSDASDVSRHVGRK